MAYESQISQLRSLQSQAEQISSKLVSEEGNNKEVVQLAKVVSELAKIVSHVLQDVVEL